MREIISDHSGSVSAGDWSPAVEAAWIAIRDDGGEIYIDEQEILLKSEAGLGVPSFSLTPLVIKGDGSNLIKIQTNTSTDALYLASMYSVAMRDLVFMSGNSLTNNTIDCKSALRLGHTQKVELTKVHFIAIKASEAVINANHESCHLLRMVDCQIGGPSAPAGVKTTHGTNVVLDGCTFWDNGNYQSDYFSKTSHGMTSWVDLRKMATGTVPSPNGANYHSTAEIKNCSFDEGAGPHIYIQDYDKVKISRCGFNVQGVEGSSSIHLKNVRHAVVQHCNAGFSGLDVPLLKVENCPNVVVVAESFDAEVFRVERDALSSVRLIHSTGVDVELV